jgi:Xaa-Pro aminopeptidase
MQTSSADPSLPAPPATSRAHPHTRHQARRRALFDAAREVDAAASVVLLCNAKDIFYLTGVREGISWLVVAGDHTIAVSRHMMVHEVREEIPECEVLLATARSTDTANMEAFVAAELSRRSLQMALLDTAKFSAASYLALAGYCEERQLQLRPASGLMESLRSIKDEHETRIIRRCVEIAELAFQQLIRHGAKGLLGKSEREVAVELERLMVSLGADRQGFPDTGIIVAGGPNSANAHHQPGNRCLQPGDPVLIDWGAELSGYRSDQTRTLFLREVPEFALEAYPVVARSLERSSALLGPGVPMSDVDRTARQTVLSAGFPEFHYGVGHGVGLDIHEGPWIRTDSTARFRENMITTVEPGIYLPGVGGIRIEKMFRITSDGATALDELPVLLEEMVLG